jgi:prepilin-type N-terminal cleavage/methylation domain-containing protein
VSAARPRHGQGFTLVEVVIATTVVGILLALSYTHFCEYTAQQRLRYRTAQVAAGLRQAQERAKAERRVYTVTVVGASPNYTIAGGAFGEAAELPEGVTFQAADTVTFTPFGRPDAAHTITIQNSAGTRTATVNAMGGITYAEP